jgi:hypothetical protein
VGTSPQMQNGPFRAVQRQSISPPLQQALHASQSQTGSPATARYKRLHFQPKIVHSSIQDPAFNIKTTCYEPPWSAPEHHPPLGLLAGSTARILRNAPHCLPAHTARHHRAVPGSPPRSLLRATGWHSTQLAPTALLQCDRFLSGVKFAGPH